MSTSGTGRNRDKRTIFGREDTRGRGARVVVGHGVREERSVPAQDRPEHTDRVPDAVGLRILGAVELAALVVAAGAPVHRDRLVEALWDTEPPRSAATALQNYVLRLRTALAPVTGVRIETVPAGYRLVTTRWRDGRAVTERHHVGMLGLA